MHPRTRTSTSSPSSSWKRSKLLIIIGFIVLFSVFLAYTITKFTAALSREEQQQHLPRSVQRPQKNQRSHQEEKNHDGDHNSDDHLLVAEDPATTPSSRRHQPPPADQAQPNSLEGLRQSAKRLAAAAKARGASPSSSLLENDHEKSMDNHSPFQEQLAAAAGLRGMKKRSERLAGLRTHAPLSSEEELERLKQSMQVNVLHRSYDIPKDYELDPALRRRFQCVELSGVGSGGGSSNFFGWANLSMYHACHMNDVDVTPNEGIFGRITATVYVDHPSSSTSSSDHNSENDNGGGDNKKTKRREEYIASRQLDYAYPRTLFGPRFKTSISFQYQSAPLLRSEIIERRGKMNLLDSTGHERHRRLKEMLSTPMPPQDDASSVTKMGNGGGCRQDRSRDDGGGGEQSSSDCTVSVYYAPHYCCAHPTHTMEPLGALAKSLRLWLAPAADAMMLMTSTTANASSSSSSSSSSFTNADEQKKAASDGNEHDEEDSPRHHHGAKRRISYLDVNRTDWCNTSALPNLCFTSVAKIMAAHKFWIPEKGLAFHSIRAVLFAAFAKAGYPPHTGLDVPIIPLNSFTKHYHRLLVPGSVYPIWGNAEDGQRFRDDFRMYLEYRQEHGLGVDFSVLMKKVKKWVGDGEEKGDEKKKKNNKGAMATATAMMTMVDDHHGVVTKADETTASSGIETPNKRIKSRGRKIAFMARASGRTISDQAAFIKFLEKCAAQVQAEVVVVRAAALSVDELFVLLRDAHVMIGLHGADLTNAVFLPPHSALVEMNPVLFWEPRFAGMAQKLNLSYHAWNCGQHFCAFKGDGEAFRLTVLERSEVSYNATTFEYTSKVNRSNGGRPLRWPYSGLVGEKHVCGRPCLDFIGKHGRLNRNFMTSFRSSGVQVMTGPTPREIAEVLFDALVAVGWASSSSSSSNDDGDASRSEFFGQLFPPHA